MPVGHEHVSIWCQFYQKKSGIIRVLFTVVSWLPVPLVKQVTGSVATTVMRDVMRVLVKLLPDFQVAATL